MAEDAATPPKKKIRWGRLFGFLLFLIAAGGVAYGLSWLNARRYYLIVDSTEVRVGKGRMLPVGYDPFVPNDPALLKAYKAFPLPGGLRLQAGEQKLEDRVELDQALFRILNDAANFSLAKDNARTPVLLATYLERLRALPGINAEQRGGVEQLARDALFVEARGHYNEGLQLLQQAAEQFAESGKGKDRVRATEAQAKADRIQAALKVLREGPSAVGNAPTSDIPKLVPPPSTSTTTATISRP